MSEVEEYSLLINKYLQGNLTPGEVARLKDWLEEDISHAKILEEAKLNWLPEAGADEELESATREMRYKVRLSQSLENGFSKAEKGRRKLYIQFLRIAAVFLAGILMTQILNMTLFSADTGEATYCTVDADRGQKSKLTLPDGTKVWLNSESKIQFTTEGFLTNRQVKLSGEAYFDVQHNDKRPFVVITKDYNVEVLGTEFNVKAYEDLERTETILVKGKVRIKKGEKEFTLNPGQKATFEANRLSIKETDTKTASSWKRNELRYEGVSFKELVFSLERWFDVQITITDPRLYEVKYSGVFKNDESIEEVLEALKYTTSINFQVKGLRQYEITFDE
ncbi:FecR family protein [Carboxylicivirga sp. RSCT41]|uniref:FecR family protein n=1 Tax=Carboxylicivirga agarovorans TaxID=3417570 RepID=UPI003D32771F